MPAKQGADSLNIPPQLPQTGQSLEVPTRELRQQPGYEQVTVTVTEPSGTYVTGLQKGDFKLYMDGQQRPIEFFRQDLNTPVSVGILVDTSGSMTPKIPQARAAIAQFLRDLNDKDDVFLFAFSSHPFLLQPFTIESRPRDAPARIAARLRPDRAVRRDHAGAADGATRALRQEGAARGHRRNGQYQRVDGE